MPLQSVRYEIRGVPLADLPGAASDGVHYYGTFREETIFMDGQVESLWDKLGTRKELKWSRRARALVYSDTIYSSVIVFTE